MARDPAAISAAVSQLTDPQARSRLLAAGLARGMIWRNGEVPLGGPKFSGSLTADLLDFGYGLLALALELRDANRERPTATPFPTAEALRVAAESIESAVRRGDPSSGDQGRHLIISGAAFHLAGFAARSFSLLQVSFEGKNLARVELALGLLLKRDLSKLRDQTIAWFSNPQHSDAGIAKRLSDPGDAFAPEDAVILALTNRYFEGLGKVDTALLLGAETEFNSGIKILADVISSAGWSGNVPLWWTATLTLHILRDLWSQSLHLCLPLGPASGAPLLWDRLRSDLIAQLGIRTPPHVDLWPSQLAAAKRVIDPHDDLVIALPTSAGKTRIAELCILRALADGKRIIYVTPLRALSAQVERTLSRTFVPLGFGVTSLYGASGSSDVDKETLQSASIVVATPEKMDFSVRQDPTVLDDVSLVVLDEGHMIGLGSREIRYEVLIQRLLRRQDARSRRIVCLSAMFNPEDDYFADFGKWLRRDLPGDFVHVRWRPTRTRIATLDWYGSRQAARLSFIEGEEAYVPRFVELQPPQKQRRKSFPSNELEFCIAAAGAFAADGHNVLVYSPQRSQIDPLVREFKRVHRQGYLDSLRAPSLADLRVALAVGREWLGEGHPAVEGLRIGVGTHHAALPRPFLTAVENLLERRKLSVVVASPTLAQGIDLACSVLIFRTLQRYDGGKGEQVPISPAEFANVLGRAGRAYVDLDGIAVYPTFNESRRRAHHQLYKDLLKKSNGQRLISGIALLVRQIAKELSQRLGIAMGDLAEYVLNHADVWTDARLHAPTDGEDGEDHGDERSLEGYLSDLDVALFSSIENLEAGRGELAKILDQALRGSLWQRTLEHQKKATARLEDLILKSRAKWLWGSTTVSQRKACYAAGLGRKAGVFLHERLDVLTAILARFDAAVAQDDVQAASQAAIEFAEIAMSEDFFSVRRLPENWQGVLRSWVSGVPFSEMIRDRASRDAQRVLDFVQDGVVFKLVWAAESVRVQAVASGHPRAEDLGDGPGFSLTYGVPFVSAALLCQIGFSSRVGAIHATRRLTSSFRTLSDMSEWLARNREILSDPDFWESEDLYTLWMHTRAPAGVEVPTPWVRKEVKAKTTLVLRGQNAGERVRLIPISATTARVCGTDLRPLGTVMLPFNPFHGALDATLIDDDHVRVTYYGRP
ncbi:MAG: DEAD/DEAH box helicase [Deltaproteobacteria bacterium]|nr:DEAD/DEAH box helicase [Deltaproteobacteria bacterium]